jgi:DNA-3-methyladenine glycosylase
MGKRSILLQNFYNRPTLTVAQDLLGCFLVRKIGKKIIRAKIIEVEAYNGPKDLASHASRGKTERNKIMFGEPGTIYVYFTYGMHFMFNIVTEEKDYPAAVLLRAVEIDGVDIKKTNGPAKLTKILQINKSHNGLSVCTKKSGLWVENRKEKILFRQIKKAKRVGIDCAGEYKNKLWRFVLLKNR